MIAFWAAGLGGVERLVRWVIKQVGFQTWSAMSNFSGLEAVLSNRMAPLPAGPPPEKCKWCKRVFADAPSGGHARCIRRRKPRGCECATCCYEITERCVFASDADRVAFEVELTEPGKQESWNEGIELRESRHRTFT